MKVYLTSAFIQGIVAQNASYVHAALSAIYALNITHQAAVSETDLALPSSRQLVLGSLKAHQRRPGYRSPEVCIPQKSNPRI
jgi:hypothetical protein